MWMLSLLVASYTLLIPGLFSTLLSYKISVWVSPGVSKQLRASTETMISFIRMLSHTGCWTGAAALVLYAMLVPLLKIILLALAERWRHAEDHASLRYSSWCIRAVQAASKWACPDMFAWILLMCLVRGMGGDAGPHLFSAAKLDVGFTCFCLFCVGSTISSLGISPPGAADHVSGRTPPARMETDAPGL